MRNGVSALLVLGLAACLSGGAVAPKPAPPFPSQAAADWLGTPASWASLHGRVVLLDVWTFG